MAAMKEKPSPSMVFISMIILSMLFSHGESQPLINPLLPKPVQCLQSISLIPECAEEISKTKFTPPLKLGPKCCNAAEKILKNCLNVNGFPVGDILLPVYSTLCGNSQASLLFSQFYSTSAPSPN